MATLNGIEYVEKWPGSPRLSLGGGRPRVERTFDVAWGDQWTFMRDMVGYPQLLPSPNGGTYVSRELPEPFYPTAAMVGDEPQFFFATDVVSVTGVGTPTTASGLNPFEASDAGITTTKDDQDIAVYELARIVVSYEPLPYPVLSDDAVDYSEVPDGTRRRYVSWRPRPQLDFLTPPTQTFRWVDTPPNNRPVPYSLPIRQPKVEFSYTWHDVPQIPGTVYIDAIYELLGTVNDALFDGMPAGTALLVGIDIEGPYWKVTPTPLYRYHYFFSYFDPDGGGISGQNFFLRYDNTNTFNYYEVSSDGTVNGTKVYSPGSFNLLFTPE